MVPATHAGDMFNDVEKKRCFYSECFFILRCYFNELDAESMAHEIICSGKTHIYFKEGGANQGCGQVPVLVLVLVLKYNFVST